MDRQAYTDWTKRAGRVLIAAALSAGSLAAAAPQSLVVLVDTGTEMPMARIEGGHLVDGMHKEIGAALAGKLGREVSFLLLPRKRIAMALESGQADLICLYLPPWLPGKFQWSQGFFPVSEVIVTDTSVAAPHKLADLAGQTIATVLGYYYPELEKTLGKDFVRDDGYSSSGNLRKMAAGRLHHAITQKYTLDYYLKVGDKISIYEPLLVKKYKSQCAVSPAGHVGVNEVNKAIESMLRDGSVDKIISNFRSDQK